MTKMIPKNSMNALLLSSIILIALSVMGFYQDLPFSDDSDFHMINGRNLQQVKDIHVNTYTQFSVFLKVASLLNGGFVIVWQSNHKMDRNMGFLLKCIMEMALLMALSSSLILIEQISNQIQQLLL